MIQFPSNPNLNDEFIAGSETYQCIDASEKIWRLIKLKEQLAKPNSSVSIAGEKALDLASLRKNINEGTASILNKTTKQVVLYLNSLQDLKLYSGVYENQVIVLKSYHSDFNAGGGAFYWDSDNVENDNSGTIISTGNASGRWIRLLDTDMSPEMFGAKGNGIDSDTLPFRLAFSATPEGSKITCLPGKTYFLDIQSDGKTLESSKSLIVDFNGSNVLYKPWSSSSPASVHTPCIFFNCTSLQPITVDPISENSNTIIATGQDLTNYSEGDYIAITTNANRQSWDYPDGVYNNFSGWGEVAKIKSVNRTSKLITTHERVKQDYSATASIQKLNMIVRPEVRNFRATEVDSDIVSTKTLAANCGHFVSFFGCVSPKVENGHVHNHRMFVFMSDYCVGASALNLSSKVVNAKYPPVGGHAYLVRHQRSHNCYTANCITDKSRHLLDYTSSYDCISENNRAVGTYGSAYGTHGFGERNITTINDTFIECGSGWSFGNPSFSFSKGFTAISTNGHGIAGGIRIWSGSSDANIISPRISGKYPFDVRDGAHNVKVSGSGHLTSSIDLEAVIVGLSHVAHTGVTNATATASVNPIVTCRFNNVNNVYIGRKMYISFANLYNLNGDKQYDGYITITSINANTITYTYDDGRTTTKNLQSDSIEYSAWIAGKYKPCKNVSIKDVTVKALPQSGIAPITISCEGDIELDVSIESPARQQLVVLDSRSVFNLPDTTKLKINAKDVECDRVILLRTKLPKLVIQDCISLAYKNSFLRYALEIDNSDYKQFKGWDISNNNFESDAPVDGITNLNLWTTVVANGGQLYKNIYPKNTNINHATNKNYEQGEFNLSVYGSELIGTAAYTNNTCKYILDKNNIKFKGRLVWKDYTGLGEMRVGGFPVIFDDVGIVSVAEVSLKIPEILVPTATYNFLNLRLYTTPVTWLKDKATGDFRFSFDSELLSGEKL